MNLNIRPLPPSEHKYGCSQTPQLASITGFIGCYIETIGVVLYEPDWTDCREDLKTGDFEADFNAVLSALRESILSSREKIQAYCRAHPECATNYLRCEHVFRIDTQDYAYILRLNRHRVERNEITYAAVVPCYLRERLDGYMKRAEKGIRFITSAWEDRFRLQDGDEILIAAPDGEEQTFICRYIDDYHFELNGYKRQETYHIRQFAEQMERTGGKITPIRASLPEKCFSVDRAMEELIVIHRGVLGWNHSWECWDSRVQYPKDMPPQEAADYLNKQLNVTKAQAAAMAAGILYGWDSPRADPACYDEQGHMLRIE